jgi:hypothetical protein
VPCSRHPPSKQNEKTVTKHSSICACCAVHPAYSRECCVRTLHTRDTHTMFDTCHAALTTEAPTSHSYIILFWLLWRRQTGVYCAHSHLRTLLLRLILRFSGSRPCSGCLSEGFEAKCRRNIAALEAPALAPEGMANSNGDGLSATAHASTREAGANCFIMSARLRDNSLKCS